MNPRDAVRRGPLRRHHLQDAGDAAPAMAADDAGVADLGIAVASHHQIAKPDDLIALPRDEDGIG